MAARSYSAVEVKADLYARIPGDGEVMLMLGNITEGDQEVSLWKYDASSSATDNYAAGVIQPTLQTGNGRWLRKNNYPSPFSRTYNFAPSRSLVTTAAAANGFQLSTSKEAQVTYSVTISCAVQIGVVANVEGYVVLEIAATNSATASDWKEVGRITNGQNIGLAIALSSTQKTGGSLTGLVPPGYYARIRSVNVSGTPTYTVNSGQETY